MAYCLRYVLPVLLCCSGFLAAQSTETMPDRAGIVRTMTQAADWQLAHPSRWENYQWHVAPFWTGLMEFAPLSADPQRYIAATKANGASNEWKPGPRLFHADDIAISQSYFQLHALQANADMIAPSLARFDAMLANPYAETLEFSNEKTRREWAWCDALYMAPPALVQASAATGDPRYTELMARLWWKTSDYLYDPEERLFYRDSRFFAQREANGAKVFWSRGNGWVLAGLARVLQHLPADSPLRPRFLAQYRDMAERIATLQGSNGYWSTSLLDPASMPQPETSGTGFFTYALAWGINHKLLDRARYEPVVQKGWLALTRAVQADGMLGYVQKVGYSPGATSADTTEIYGVGALLQAGVQVYQLSEK